MSSILCAFLQIFLCVVQTLNNPVFFEAFVWQSAEKAVRFLLQNRRSGIRSFVKCEKVFVETRVKVGIILILIYFLENCLYEKRCTSGIP